MPSATLCCHGCCITCYFVTILALPLTFLSYIMFMIHSCTCIFLNTSYTAFTSSFFLKHKLCTHSIFFVVYMTDSHWLFPIVVLQLKFKVRCIVLFQLYPLNVFSCIVVVCCLHDTCHFPAPYNCPCITMPQ